MVKFVRSALEALEKALYLSEFSRVCRDPDQLRETALAVLRDRRSERTKVAVPGDGREDSHRLAA